MAWGIAIIIDIRKNNPHKKSIQLAKSFNNPKQDFASKIIPKKIIIWFGSENSAPNKRINPAIKSNNPSILTSIFFKSNYPLKICACNSAWIECQVPNLEVAGSNPAERI